LSLINDYYKVNSFLVEKNVLISLNYILPKAIDEGMTCGSSKLSYLVFGPGRISTKGTARPTNMIAWRDPGVRLDVQGKARRDQVELGLD
jgi:hypothetical protein